MKSLEQQTRAKISELGGNVKLEAIIDALMVPDP